MSKRPAKKGPFEKVTKALAEKYYKIKELEAKVQATLAECETLKEEITRLNKQSEELRVQSTLLEQKNANFKGLITAQKNIMDRCREEIRKLKNERQQALQSSQITSNSTSDENLNLSVENNEEANEE